MNRIIPSAGSEEGETGGTTGTGAKAVASPGTAIGLNESRTGETEVGAVASGAGLVRPAERQPGVAKITTKTAA
jgi:hypothetical protein